MRDLMQEGRQIQKKFKTNVVEANVLTEGAVSDVVNKLFKLAKDIVVNKKDELSKFIDFEKLEKDPPSISQQEIKSEAESLLRGLGGETNEGISDVVSFIQQKGKSLLNSVQSMKKTLSMLKVGSKLMGYIKDPAGLFRFMKNELTRGAILLATGISMTGMAKGDDFLDNPFHPVNPINPLKWLKSDRPRNRPVADTVANAVQQTFLNPSDPNADFGYYVFLGVVIFGIVIAIYFQVMEDRYNKQRKQWTGRM